MLLCNYGWKGFPSFEFINDTLGHIIEGGIFMHIMKRNLDQLKKESKYDIPINLIVVPCIS